MPGDWDNSRQAQRGMASGGRWNVTGGNGTVCLNISAAQDGTTNTILYGEIGRGENQSFLGGIAHDINLDRDNSTSTLGSPRDLCLNAVNDPTNPGIYDLTRVSVLPREFQRRGSVWAMGAVPWSGFNTIMPPNSPNCDGTQDSGDEWWRNQAGGMYSAGSYHSGGCQVVMVDGSVQFINDAIDTGDLSLRSVTAGRSPYGVWGALGSRNGGEVTDSAF